MRPSSVHVALGTRVTEDTQTLQLHLRYLLSRKQIRLFGFGVEGLKVIIAVLYELNIIQANEYIYICIYICIYIYIYILSVSVCVCVCVRVCSVCASCACEYVCMYVCTCFVGRYMRVPVLLCVCVRSLFICACVFVIVLWWHRQLGPRVLQMCPPHSSSSISLPDGMAR